MSSDPLQDFFLRALRVRHATMIELLEVRKGIEVQSASLAAQRRTSAQLSALGQGIDDMRMYLYDREEYRRVDIELHLRIAAASHNTLLYHLVESMREPMRDSMQAVGLRRVTAPQHEFAVTAHHRIVDAIARREPDEAGRAMSAHFDEAIRLISQDANQDSV
jgi:DNA-binding FadR family transcriptional regulator